MVYRRFSSCSGIIVRPALSIVSLCLLTHDLRSVLYTGNGRIARIVAAAAAKNLTPLTLEVCLRRFVMSSPLLIVASTSLAVCFPPIHTDCG